MAKVSELSYDDQGAKDRLFRVREMDLWSIRAVLESLRCDAALPAVPDVWPFM